MKINIYKCIMCALLLRVCVFMCYVIVCVCECVSV